MIADYLSLWMRDCAPDVLADKVLHWCQTSGEKATAGDACECPAHLLLDASQTLADLKAASSSLTALTEQLDRLTIDHAAATADLAAATSALAAAVKDRDTAISTTHKASAEALDLSLQVRDLKQSVATLQTGHGEAVRLYTAAKARLDQLESTLKALF